MQTDIWAITPSTSATLLKAAAAIGGAGAVPLLTNNVATNGAGYQLLITSAGDDSGITFTVVGLKVGALTGGFTTEVIPGPNASTATSTNFYSYVQSITASGASDGDVSIGTTGSLALPRTRVKGVYYVGATNDGSIDINLNSASGTLLLRLATPAGSAAMAENVKLPGAGILTGKADTDFSVVTLSGVSNATLFCG